jgi:hypothetical protein
MTITHDYEDDWDYVNKKPKDKGKCVNDSDDQRTIIED